MAEDSAGMPAATEPAPTEAGATEPAPAATEPAPAVAPTIRVLGGATPEQVAALVSVLSAAGGAEHEPPPPRRSGWAAYEAGIRRPPHPGPGVWQSSLRRS